jgi:hypothetical protein
MIITDKHAFDSVRSKDGNGYLHVAVSNLTKEQVVPYRGDSIPEHKELGLDPDKVYMIYRPAEAIEKAADSFNGLPLTLDHWNMDAETIPKDKVVGSLGTEARWEAPYLKNSLIVTDANAIRAIEDGSFAELSAAYACDLDMQGGFFDGVAYDGVMKNIEGNHVALVREGRAGHDVRVEDSALKGGDKEMTLGEKLKEFLFENIINKEALKAMEKTANMNEMPQQAVDVEPVDEVADEIRELMKAAGLDPEDKAAQKAFLAGMAAGKPVEDEEPKTDECGEAAKDEETKTDECGEAAKDEDPTKVGDSAMVHDKAFYAGLFKAAEDVAPIVGKINNPMAFDSADAIYKKALDKVGVITDGVDSSAFGAMVAMYKASMPKAYAKAVDVDDPLNKILQGIKSR